MTIPATATVNYEGLISDEAAPRLRLSYFDNAFSMWRPVYTTIDPASHTATVEIDRFAKWALIEVSDVARPNFDAEIEALIVAAPEEAVGYQIEVGFSDPPGDLVILSGMGKSGGCDDQYKTGSSTQMTSKGKIFSDHLEYQIVAVWQLADGCPERQSIE